jgi:hypothetical protein
MKIENLGGAFGSVDDAIGFLEHGENVLPFDFLHRNQAEVSDGLVLTD